MAKEARVTHLRKELGQLKMSYALMALDWMINTMNADNGYKRRDGSHYYYHLVDATQDLLNHGIRDEATITACILHDAVEDIDYVEVSDIELGYGADVARIVDLVTKKKGVDYKKEENLKQYLKDILTDVRACLVKTADRKHNFSTLYSTSAKHELRQAIETELYFLPFFKEARKKYGEYSAYFHSAKTTIMPHLNRIKRAHEEESKLKEKIKELEEKLKNERKRNNALENKIRKMKGENKMKGIMLNDMRFMFVNPEDVERGELSISEVDVSILNKGVIEVLKVIETPEYISGKAYVIFDPETLESMTVDSSFVKLIAKKEFDEIDKLVMNAMKVEVEIGKNVCIKMKNEYFNKIADEIYKKTGEDGREMYSIAGIPICVDDELDSDYIIVVEDNK